MANLPFDTMAWPPIPGVKELGIIKYSAAQKIVNQALHELKDVDLANIIEQFYHTMERTAFNENTVFKFQQQDLSTEMYKEDTVEFRTFLTLKNAGKIENTLFKYQPFEKLKYEFMSANQNRLHSNISILFLLVDHFMAKNRINHKLSFHTIGHALEVAEATVILVDKTTRNGFKLPGKLKHWKLFMFCCALFHDAIFTRTRCDDEFNSAKLFYEAFFSLTGQGRNTNFINLVRVIIIGGTLPLILIGKPLEELFQYCDFVENNNGLGNNNYTVLRALLESISYADVHRTCFNEAITRSKGSSIKSGMLQEFIDSLFLKQQEGKKRDFGITSFTSQNSELLNSVLKNPGLTFAKLGHNIRVIIEGFAPFLSLTQEFMLQILLNPTRVEEIMNAAIGKLKTFIADPEAVGKSNVIINTINAMMNPGSQSIKIFMGPHDPLKLELIKLAKDTLPKIDTNNKDLMKQLIYISVLNTFVDEIIFQTTAARTHKPTYLTSDFNGDSWKELADLYKLFLEKIDRAEEIVHFVINAARLQQSLKTRAGDLLNFIIS